MDVDQVVDLPVVDKLSTFKKTHKRDESRISRISRLSIKSLKGFDGVDGASDGGGGPDKLNSPLLGYLVNFCFLLRYVHDRVGLTIKQTR